MKALKIEARDDSPMVNLDKDQGVFEISGKSLPEDVIEFYQPIFDWIDAYAKDALDETVFSFKMIYFNTASSKVILDILMKLEGIAEQGKNVLIKWYALERDEDMAEAGEEYSDMVDLTFEHLTFQK